MATDLEEFKPVVDLDRDGLSQTIPAQDRLSEWHPYNQTKLHDQWPEFISTFCLMESFVVYVSKNNPA